MKEQFATKVSRRGFLLIGSSAGAVYFLSPKVQPAQSLQPEDVTIVEFSDSGQRQRTIRVAKIVKSESEWKKQLSRETFEITRHADTERSYTGKYWNMHDKGLYRCICCDTALFSSETKYDSNTGWPSFWQPIAPENIETSEDRSFGMIRTAVECRRCDAHLGHVFNDGPRPSGLRYCINSASLRFVKSAGTLSAFPDPAVDEPLAASKAEQAAVLAGGCFWGVEAVFEHVRGVKNVTSGYSGGTAATANYDMVGTGRTGHAESVRIVYDPSQISYGQLLKVFFSVAHDPTELNRQGPDEGPQYRSAIFFADEDQKRIAQAYINQINQAKVFRRPVVTQVVGLTAYYQAEAEHQDYVRHHPNQRYIIVNDLPKLANLRKQLPELYVGK